MIQRILTSTVYEEKLEAFEKLLELSAEKKQVRNFFHLFFLNVKNYYANLML